MDEQYKISLGVDIDIGDLQSQINKAGDKVTPIPIKVEIENLAEIKKQIQNLGNIKGGTKLAIPIDTDSLEVSLNEVATTIKEIKNSIGTLDSKSGMKSLLSSINQITDALEKASNQFVELNANLNALASKDFSINFGINMGGSNQIARNAAYGNVVRSETLPQLKAQMNALVEYYNNTFKTSLSEFEVLQRMVSGTKLGNGDFFENFLFGKDSVAVRMSSGSLASQMQAYREYIDLFRQAASLKGLDISGVTSGFSKSADDLVRDAQNIQTGANEMEESFKRLKEIFGGSNSLNVEGLSAQLDSIVADLGEIKIALQGLSSGFSIDGLTESFDRLSASIDRLVRDCGEARTAVSSVVGDSGVHVSGDGAADDVNRTADELKTAYNKLKNISKNIGSIRIKLASGLDSSDDIQQLKVLEAQLESLTAEYHETVAKIKGKGDLSSTQWQTIQHQIDNTKLKLEQLEAEVADTRNKIAKKIELKLERGDFDNDISSINSKFDKLSKKSDETRVAIDAVEQALSDMRTASANGDIEGLIAANERYERSLKNVKNQLDINARAERDALDMTALQQSRDKLSLDMDNWLKENSAAAKQFGGRIKELQAQINSCDKTSLARLRAEFTNIKKEAQLAGKNTQTFADRLKAQFSKYSSYLSVASVFMYAAQGLRSMFEQVKSIDSAMTELKKVTNETEASYNQFLTNAASRAKELGTTIDGLVESTADFARLGYGFEDAQGLAEVANIYAVVGDEIDGVEDATKSLISTMAAFKDETSGISDSDFAMDIVDKFNEVSNNFAISSGGIGEAMQRSASSLRAANNTIDESIALITAANEVTQDPAVVGTAFKTMSMRIRGAKTELEEMGEDTSGMVESTAKLREEILALSGVDIMLDNNTFKSTYQILDELAVKWKDLTDIQQASITELIAGKRQGNVVSSLMQNFDVARDALETSLNSSGSAMAEHEKWSRSLEARLNSLKATWQSLSQTFLKSDFLKGALDFITGLINGLDKLIDFMGVLPTLATAFAAFQSFQGVGLFTTIEDEAKKSGYRITNIFKKSALESTAALQSIGLSGSSAFKDGIKSDIAIFGNYKKAMRDGMSEVDAWNKHMSHASVEFQNFAKSGKLATEGVSGFIKQQQAAEVATLAQNKSLGNARGIIKEYYSGCKNVGIGQEAFADAVRQTNPQLAAAMTTSNSAAGATVRYTTSLIGAKAATIGLQIATTALNAVIGMGIGALISVAISAITKWINSADELAEKVEEVTSKYKEQHDALIKLKGDYDTSNEDSMISKYEKLSRGVDHLGRNVSLTADEYSEYQSIVNKIADQIPSLVSGYDAQGNALLSCKGNVEELTKAYENLIKTQNNEVLSTAGDIGKDFANKVKDNNKQGIGDIAKQIFTLGLAGDSNMSEETIRRLENILSYANSDKLDWAIENQLSGDDALHNYRSEIKAALKSAGVDVELFNFDESLAEAVNKHPEIIKGIIDDYRSGLEESAAQMKTIAQAALSDAFDLSDSEYYDMSDTMKGVVRNVVNSFDYEFYKAYTDNPLGVKTYINDMLDQLKTLGDADGAKIEAAFDLQTQFNGGEISYGEYVDGLENTGELIDGLDIDKELKTQLKLSIGLNEKGLVAEYHQLRNRLADSELFNIMPSEYEPFLEDLSAEELSVLIDIIPELSETDYKETIADIESALKTEMMLKGLYFDLNLEVETAGIEALNTALAESVSGAGLSSESITALKSRYADLESQGYDLSVMFEETSHGAHLNRQEFNKLEKAYAAGKLAEVDGELAEMKGTYDDLGEAIKNCDDPVRKSELYNERQTLAQKINEAATLAAQYKGLTSAYNDWLAAEEAGQERDMYENVISGFETIDDEVSRGWYDDSTIEFLELLTGKDLSSAGINEIKKAYKGLGETIKYVNKEGKVLEDTGYSVRDFFTVDDEGNSTADGVYNFLDAIGRIEEEAFGGKDVVKRNKNGKVIAFDFELAGGDEAIAEALGVSEELVQIMKRAADDAGFVVTLDGSYKQLADLQNEARESAEYLKSIGKTNVDFDFNTTSIKNLNQQLEEAHKILDDPDFWNKDGTFNYDAKGATEAMQIVSTLQAKIDSLTQEKYGIGLTVEDEEFEEPLEKLQNYGRTVATLNQLKLNPKANTEDIEKFEGELEDIAKYFAELDGDKKVKLGFDADDNWEEVQKKIESGEVKIPTVLDIQANMDKNIETLADLALLNSGLLTDSEEETIKKKYKIDVEADEVDTSDIDDKVDDAIGDDDGKATRKQNIQIIAETFGVEDVDDLTSKLKGLDDKTIQAIAEVLGRTDVEKLQQTMALIEPKKVQAIAEAIGKGDVDGLKTAINQLSPKQVQAIAEALGYSDVNELNTTIEGMDGNTVQAVAQALGLTDVNTLQITINNMQGNTVNAGVNTDGQASKIDTLQTKINSLKGRIVNVGVQIAAGGKKKAAQRTGADPAGNDSEVNGTAHVNGTTGRAFKQGNWGTKNSGTALVGELGAEVLVRNGRYYRIGEHGAEFIKYKQGDIIFNHKQTEELFRNGKVTSGGGRAKAFVGGTAFDEGTNPDYGGTAVGSNKDDKSEETFDWIETLISRLERVIDNLDKTVNNVYKSWSDRNTALTDEIGKVGEEISLQQSAYTAYIDKANEVGLDESWASKVRNGAIDIDTVTDEKLAEKIRDYQTWYEKALDAKDAIEDLKQTEAELYQQRFENVQSQYDGILQGFEHTESMLNEYISQAEAQGYIVSENYYRALIDNERNNVAELQKKQVDLIAKRDEAVVSGAIVRGSQAWYDMCAEIDSVTQAIEEGNTALIEYANSMRDIDWQVFDLIQERISDVTAEADFLIDLMSNDKLYDDNGKLTDKGMATMGLHGQNYNTYMYQADDYGKEVAELDKQIAQDPYDQELINRRQELIELQRESILAAEDEKNAIRDLVEEGINLELEALQERIDLHNEELDSMKDLYDYQKKVKEQTEEIASLEKQMAAYANDDSEEAKSKIQELKVSLEDAKADLEESEYDRYISDQSALLDSLYEEYELILNQRLDNVDALLEQVIAEINIAAGAEGAIATALGTEGAMATALGNNAATIKTTLETEAKSVGTTLSTAMKGIWSVDEGNAKSVLETYGKGFQDKQTTTNAVLGDIKTYINRMVDDVDKDATKKVGSNKTSSSSKKDPTKTTATKKAKKTTATNKSSGDGTPKIGDKVKFLSGKYYYDSQGVTPAGSKNHGKQVYITNINKKKWATHPYHISTGKKLGSGDLGWLKLNQISGYATGKQNFLDNEIAWTQENGQEFIVRPSDGAILTPIAKGDSVLTSAASSNIWDMANSPADFIKDNLNLGTANVPNNSTVQSNYTQNLDKVVFNFPNVRNYDEMLSAMQKDKNFERLVMSMTIDQIAGKSSLAKGKSIR